MTELAMMDGNVRVTADSVDPIYHDPIIEIDEERAEPVPHRYIHGGFRGTDARFSFYFPPAAQYQGRFFHNTYPMAISSDIGPFPIQFEVAVGDLGFTLDSGAAYVQTNNGGLFGAAGSDPAIAAYRVNAAAAKFARVVAGRIFGEHRTYGYLFGGSGGAYQTMGAAEFTDGVWDGFVPFVPGCNHAIPSMFTVRMHALRVLRQRDRLPGVADAVAVGGSGDPYADLNEEEAAALREVSLMGFPLRGWYRQADMDSGYFANVSGMIPLMDPTYVDDFWSQPGYLGTDPASRIGEGRFAVETTVVSVSAMPPWRVEVADASAHKYDDAHLAVVSGASAGASLPIAHGGGTTLDLVATVDPAAMAGLKPGDKVRIDNSWALALETYHRHQLPPTPDYYGWSQFRDAAGAPLYPQRDVLIGPPAVTNSAGAMLTGKVNGKVLLLSALMDIDAFPWQADWYRGRIRAALGDSFDDMCAIWFVDHAHHENPLTPLQRAHVASFGGALQQALRDLACWVEEGVKPSETAYRVVDTQVIVPDDAAARGGVQPVVHLTANGGERAEVSPGEAVAFTATITVPAGAGKVVSAEWDFVGAGDYPVRAEFAPAETVTLTARHAYDTAGTRFPVLRVASQREGDAATPYGRVLNLAQARVVVA
ncbi:hypothetical protein [Novosphingobium album (ex Liu et al. 2023)]|uniref:Tannase/feruloyl esterase family alpha/beta hydrolase n=1 Tax=Novosphingobium album (ex Liu et al. 2023) TaxID=3031130 RepID=A0ABT5WRB8_9SPHN|nr:hypothetical protein [Novosphingobium album (ex Liu et al. 2023)]MDE8652584.1 hypothetical protein [Novosphingobium album (ex Liu et al. 2023)]